MAAAEPDRYFFCDQYGNDYNWRAHAETTAQEILRQTDGRVTHFVAGVGDVFERIHQRSIQIKNDCSDIHCYAFNCFA